MGTLRARGDLHVNRHGEEGHTLPMPKECILWIPSHSLVHANKHAESGHTVISGDLQNTVQGLQCGC